MEILRMLQLFELGKVPNVVKKMLQWHLGQLRDMARRIAEGRYLDFTVGGDGRYEFEATGGSQIRNLRVQEAEEYFAKFRSIAERNGVNADQVFEALGGIPTVPKISQAADAWLIQTDIRLTPQKHDE